MIRTKRILALFLAVVLIFSALPFSVSADELPGELSTESTVESQPEESQAEEPEEQAPAENAITISDSSGDVPVLYAQDPFNTVKSDWAPPTLAATPNRPMVMPPTTAAPWE